MTSSHDMPTSLAAIHAAGASSLELALGGEDEPQTPISPVRNVLRSPIIVRSCPQASQSPTSFQAQSFVRPQPMPLLSPTRTIPPSPFTIRSSPMPSPTRSIPSSSPVAASPFLARLNSSFTSPGSPSCTLTALSPGGAIRHNAAVFGIPLDLRGGYVQDQYSVPIPVRTSSGAVVAPSPVAARGGHLLYSQPAGPSGLQPMQLNFGMPPPMPAVGTVTVPHGGHSYVSSSAAPFHQVPPAAIRSIVTPLRSGVRGGA